MSNQYREVDEIDYILRDALRSNRDAAPNAERLFAALRARVVAEHRPARTVWTISAPNWAGSYMSVSYWYLAPLTRVMR
jgi:hypothetical protein